MKLSSSSFKLAQIALSPLTPSLLLAFTNHLMGIVATTGQSAPNRRIAISAFPYGFSAFSLNIGCQVLLFRKHAQIEFLPS
jgi:hypothetical protein